MISSGSAQLLDARAPRSWAAVRAPTIGAVTPGRSRTQASATSSGGPAEPVGGPGHRLDDPRRAVVEVGLDEAGEVRRRAARVRRGAGAVLAGEHAAAQRRPGQHAEPERGGRGQHLVLDPRG